jgi:hypothetical protein
MILPSSTLTAETTMKKCLLVVLLAALTLGSDSPRAYDDAVAVDDVEGTWQYLGFEFEGDWHASGGHTTFSCGTFVYEHMDIRQRGPYATDTSRRPAVLRYTVAEGIAFGFRCQSLFWISGDQLNIAYKKGGVLPSNLEDKTELVIETYKRVKK